MRRMSGRVRPKQWRRPRSFESEERSERVMRDAEKARPGYRRVKEEQSLLNCT